MRDAQDNAIVMDNMDTTLLEIRRINSFAFAIAQILGLVLFMGNFQNYQRSGEMGRIASSVPYINVNRFG